MNEAPARNRSRLSNTRKRLLLREPNCPPELPLVTFDNSWFPLTLTYARSAEDWDVKPKEWLPHTLNVPFVEQLYTAYRADAASVSEEWRRFFAESENGDANEALQDGPSFRPPSLF